MTLASRLRRAAKALRWLNPLATRPLAASVAVGILAFAGCLAVASRVGERQASIHDELANVLGADTFAHGRLANPTPELWPYFESPHILVRPVYASKYPPGQSLFIAVGQVLTGHPIVGVWLSVALACAAVCWMLQAWLPPAWALGGGLLAAARLVLLAEDGRWSQSFWAGAVAVLGAAVVLGAVGRLSVKHRRRDGVAFAAGLLLLAISRPFEGVLFSLPMMVLVLRSRPPPDVVVNTALTLAFGMVLLGAYHARLTGHFWLFPHAEYQRQYGIVPMFLWQNLTPQHAYGTIVLEKFNREYEMGTWERLHSWPNYLHELLDRAEDFPTAFLGLAFALPLLLLPFFRWPKRWRWLLASLFFVCLGLVQTTYYHTHYAAPLMPLLVLLALQGTRVAHVARWRGIRIGRAVPLLLTLTVVAQLLWSGRALRPTVGWPAQRAVVERQLTKMGGKHLVIVRYDAGHSPHHEWVYNGADLDNAQVLWVHELKPVPDQTLLKHYADRTAWLVEPDHGPSSLRPYGQPDGERRRRWRPQSDLH